MASRRRKNRRIVRRTKSRIFRNPRVKRRRTRRVKRRSAIRVSAPRRRVRRRRRSRIVAVARRATRSVARRTRRVRRRASVAIRRRSRSRSGGLMKGFSIGSVKSVFSKDNLMVAGGVVLSSIVTVQVIDKFGPVKPVLDAAGNKQYNASGQLITTVKDATEFVLPGLRPAADGTGVNPWAVAGWGVAVPIATAFAIRKFQPRLAQGMIIGGLVTGITEGIKQAMKKPAAPRAAVAAQSAMFYSQPGRLPAPQTNMVRPMGASPVTSSVVNGGSQSPYKNAWARGR